MKSDADILKAAAALLGCTVEDLDVLAKEWGCNRSQAAETLVEAAETNEALRATRELSDEELLQANATAAGVSVAELQQTADDWMLPTDQTAALLVERRQLQEERATRPPAPKPRRMAQPTRVLADAKHVVANAQSQAGARAAGLDQSLKRGLQQLPGPGRPPGASYRSQVVRRVSDPLSPPLWFFRFGAHACQVQAWLRDWKRLDSRPVERAIVSCLRAEMYRRGEGMQGIFPIAALAYLLWFDSRPTARPGYCFHLQGVPRGELARRMAHKNRGDAVDADTISRYLAELGRVLRRGGDDADPSSGGLLEWEQPQPEAAVREKLHKSTHYLADGSRQIQATNIYWWRDAKWVEREGYDPKTMREMFEGKRSLPDGNNRSALEDVPGAREALQKMQARSTLPSLAEVVDPATGFHTDKLNQQVSSPSDGGESDHPGRPRAPPSNPTTREQPP